MALLCIDLRVRRDRSFNLGEGEHSEDFGVGMGWNMFNWPIGFDSKSSKKP